MIDSVVSRLLRTRAVVRAPIWLYRHRAGWLLGSRMLMLEHISVGKRTSVAAQATLLSEQESAAVLDRYQEAHPRAWRRLRGAIETAVGHEVEGLPMVNLRLLGD